MVQTSLSTQTKVLLVSTAALATGLAAYALGYYDYDWRLLEKPSDQTQQAQPGAESESTQGAGQELAATLVSDPKLPDALVGRPYQTSLRASTGANTRWSLVQGALPSGLVLDEARGTITGTATFPSSSLFRLKFGNTTMTGLSQFTLNVISGEGGTDPSEVTPGPSQPVQAQITTSAIPNGRVGQEYRAELIATGGDPAARSWRFQGAVPPGLKLSTNGVLGGTPTQVGNFLVSVVLTTHPVDRPLHSYDVVRQYMLVVSPAEVIVTDLPLKIITTQLPAGRVGVDYKQLLTATGGPTGARYIWQIPVAIPGLTSNEDGYIYGVPTTPGTYDLRKVTVTARDVAGSHSADYTLQILPRESVPTTPSQPPAIAPLVISGGYPDGGIGGYYSSRPLEVSGGQAPYQWSVHSGNLPTGLYFSQNSQIAGYANQYGIFTFTVQVRDQENRMTRVDRTIHIRPAQPVVSASIDPDLSNRLHRIDLMGVQVHDLIKLQDDGNPDTQFDTTVYYIGADGRRHSFPNPKVYFSWFSDFSRVRVVASRELADIPLGANLTYRPGTRLVKFMTDPRVYAVDSDRRLRWVKTESVAQTMYGPFWARQVDDVSDAFYMDYRFGQDINALGDYSVSAAIATAAFPSDVLPR